MRWQIVSAGNFSHTQPHRNTYITSIGVSKPIKRCVCCAIKVFKFWLFNFNWAHS